MKIKQVIPFIILVALFALLWRELVYSKPNELPSALIGEIVPNFHLQDIKQPQQIFTPKNLMGQVSLLNVWATWCYACTLETEMLMKIRQHYHVPIFGIDYKDNPQDARQWLQKYGDPYEMIGNDSNGSVGIDFGVYGTPETFVIAPNGRIIYRHVGAITQKVWDEELQPLIKSYEKRAQ